MFTFDLPQSRDSHVTSESSLSAEPLPCIVKRSSPLPKTKKEISVYKTGNRKPTQVNSAGSFSKECGKTSGRSTISDRLKEKDLKICSVVMGVICKKRRGGGGTIGL